SACCLGRKDAAIIPPSRDRSSVLLTFGLFSPARGQRQQNQARPSNDGIGEIMYRACHEEQRLPDLSLGNQCTNTIQSGQGPLHLRRYLRLMMPYFMTSVPPTTPQVDVPI